MGKVVYATGVSLDGYIAGPAGEIDWAAPDLDLHSFHNEQMRAAAVHLLGRRLYETMVYWETADQSASLAPVELEWARIWQQVPKVVFSRTLDRVVGNATLKRDGLADDVRRYRAQAGGEVAVGGAGLASELIGLGLVDEYRLFISPVVLGGGTPFFPALDRRLMLERLESREFGRGVVYVRYAAAT
jgi:dihydrofolate reductase